MDGSDFLITINEHSFKLNIVRWDEVTSQIFKAYSTYKLNNNIKERPLDEQQRITPGSIFGSKRFDIPIRTQLEPEKNNTDQNADTNKKVETTPIRQKTVSNKKLSYEELTLLEQAKAEYNNVPIYLEIVEHIKTKTKNYTKNTPSEIADAIYDFYTNVIKRKIQLTCCKTYASQYRKYLINRGYIQETPEQHKTEQPVTKKGCNEDKDEFQIWIEKTKPTSFTLQQFIDTYPRKLTEDQAIIILTAQILRNTILQTANKTFKVKQTGGQ